MPPASSATGGSAEFVRLPGLDTDAERVFVCKAMRLVLVVALVVTLPN